MKKIKITVGSLTMEADLNDTPTAIKIAGILPFKSAFNTWGEEIYFDIPVESELDSSAREVVETGDLGYWPTGQAFAGMALIAAAGVVTAWRERIRATKKPGVSV